MAGTKKTTTQVASIRHKDKRANTCLYPMCHTEATMTPKSTLAGGPEEIHYGVRGTHGPA